MLIFEDELKLPSLPPTPPGQDLTIPNVPFYGDMIFKPVIIQWNGIISNPFYSDEKFKTVRYYTEKSNPNRVSKDKNTLILNTLFTQYPELKTEEHLDLPLGKFAKKLKDDYPNLKIKLGSKQKSYPAYKVLVNPSGGEDDYISFNVENLTQEKGLYIWVIDNKPTYIGIAAAPRGLYNRINSEYGSVTSYKCSIDGQSQTCRSNTKLRDEYNAKKSVALYVLPIDVKKYKNDPKFIEVMDTLGFKGTRIDKNVLEIFEKFIIKKGNFKTGGWNRRMEEGFMTRLQELAGIPKKHQILYRIDPSLEKLGIEDGDEVESGSKEWIELVSLIFQVPFEDNIEEFALKIDKKSKELNFSIQNLELQLDIRDIKII